MSKPTTDARGRRYSSAEKEKVLNFIAQANRKHGEGGQAAAHREFGIANVTLRLWMKQGPGLADHLSASHTATAQALLQLTSLATKIVALEKKLTRMRHDYERLQPKP